MNGYPDSTMQAYNARLAGLRQRVRELWDYSQRMDYADPDHLATFQRLHAAIWDACIGPELPHVQRLFRTMPARTQAERDAVSRRIFELREMFIKPTLIKAVGDMPEAHQLALFHQSKMEPKYV